MPNGNFLVGQNDITALILDPFMQEVSRLQLGSELISVEIVEDEVFCGLGNKTICILDKEARAIKGIIQMKEVV